MKKRIISLFLALVLVVGVLPAGSLRAGALTSGDWEYEVHNGTATITGYNGRGGYITIPSTLGGYSVTTIGVGAFWECFNLRSVNIPISVTVIDAFAFFGCVNVLSITIPYNLTTINEGAFFACMSLTSISIPPNVTNIGEGAFIYCINLKAIGVNVNNKNYASVNDVLFDKSMKKLICYPVAKPGSSYTIPSSTTSIDSWAFSDCKDLKAITIPHSVTSIGNYAFDGCTGLNTLIIGDGVKNLNGFSFKQYKYLTTLIIGNGVTTDIIGLGFNRHEYLTSITIGNGIKRIGNEEFSYCKNLTSVTFGNSLTSIGELAFFNCQKLETITFSDSITSIGRLAFSGTAWQKNLPSGMNYVGKMAYAYTGGISEITELVLKEGTKGIASHAFLHCGGLISVIIPESVTNIDEEAFYYCRNLTSITFKSTKPPSLGRSAFYFDSKTKIYVPIESKELYKNIQDLRWFQILGIPTISGDCNMDYKIDASDLSFLKRYLSGKGEYNEYMDCNGDGDVNLADLTYLKRHLAGYPGYDL